MRNIKDIIDEIEFLVKKYNINMVKLQDANFFVSKKRVEEFADEIIKRGLKIRWYSTVRSDYFRRYDGEFLEKLKKSGCTQMWMGIESGSEKILKLILKDQTTEDAIRAAELCKEHGLVPVYSFMIGIPYETKDDVLATLRLMRRLKRITMSCFLGPQIFRPYPGGDLYELSKKLGFKEPDNLEGWEYKVKDNIFYMGAEELPWVEDPHYIEVIVKYAPKGFNNYLNYSPFPWNILFNLRSWLFETMILAYASSNNGVKKKFLESSLKFLDNLSQTGKRVIKGTTHLLEGYT